MPILSTFDLRNQSSLQRKPSPTKLRKSGRTTCESQHCTFARIVLIRFRCSSLDDGLTNAIRLLSSIAVKLRAKRMAAGALNLASPEVKIHMESNESSDPIDVEQKTMYQTNSLVEEFMLLANISVAERIYEQFPQTAVLRSVLSSYFSILLADDTLQTARTAAEDELRGSAGCTRETTWTQSRRFDLASSRRFSRFMYRKCLHSTGGASLTT